MNNVPTLNLPRKSITNHKFLPIWRMFSPNMRTCSWTHRKPQCGQFTQSDLEPTPDILSVRALGMASFDIYATEHRGALID